MGFRSLRTRENWAGQTIFVGVEGYSKGNSPFAMTSFGEGDGFFLFLSQQSQAGRRKRFIHFRPVRRISAAGAFTPSFNYQTRDRTSRVRVPMGRMRRPCRLASTGGRFMTVCRGQAPWREARVRYAEDVPWLLALLKEKRSSQSPFWFRDMDMLGADAARRLVAVGSFNDIQRALEIDPNVAMILDRAFAGPDALEFLFNGLKDMRLSSASRLQLAGAMTEMSWTAATRPATDSQFPKAKYFSQLAEVTSINASDEDVAKALVFCCGQAVRFSKDFNPSMQLPEVKKLLPGHCERVFHRKARQSNFAEAIEKAMTNFDRSDLTSWVPNVGRFHCLPRHEAAGFCICIKCRTRQAFCLATTFSSAVAGPGDNR